MVLLNVLDLNETFGPPANLNPNPNPACCSVWSGCGATLSNPSGTITSPGHPSIYPHGANCTWFISVPPGNLLQLVFESFNLEYHANCNFDYVEVYDNGTVETGTKLGR